MYELRPAQAGASLHLFEPSHDAAIVLTPEQIVELRADLATVLLLQQPGDPVVGASVRSEAGLRVLEDLRRIFVALVELVLPERVMRVDANRVLETLGEITLTTAEARWLHGVLGDLVPIMEKQDAEDQAALDARDAKEPSRV